MGAGLTLCGTARPMQARGWGVTVVAGNQLTLPHLFLPRAVIILQ